MWLDFAAGQLPEMGRGYIQAVGEVQQVGCGISFLELAAHHRKPGGELRCELNRLVAGIDLGPLSPLLPKSQAKP